MLIYIFRLLLSLGLGALIGYERDQQDKPAGLRDVSIVSVGATLFALLVYELMFQFIKLNLSREIVRFDIGRIFAYVIVSIGFLGSGVIISKGGRIEGITTAGILWSSVAIGLLVGIGSYWLAVISAVLLYFILKVKHIRAIWRRKNGKNKSN